MFAKKLRAVAAVVLTAGLVLAGAYRTATADPVPAAPPAARAEPIPPPKRVPAAELAPKKPTVIPLKKVDPEKAAKAIAEKYKEKGVTAAALPGEKAVLVYADEETTFYIEESLLLDLGEDPPKKVYAYRLAEGVDAVALAKAYAKPPTSITAVPVPSERLLLLYATRLEAKVLGPFPPDGQRLREPVPEKPAAEPKKYTVDFRGVPWADVLDWYAKESGLTPTFSVKPTGTVTIATPKNRQFTLVEVTDLINEALLSQKFLLVRRQVTFTIVPADEKIDPSQIPRVDLSDLSQRGKTELVQVLLPLKTLTVAEAAPEVSKMLTPFGTLSSLAKVNTLVITDTAGNITRIVQTLQKVEGGSDGDVLTHQFLYVKATDMAEKLKTLLTDATRVKPVAVIVDVKANSVTVTGPPEKIALAKRIIEETDKPQFPGQNPIRVDDPELRKYSVPRGTAEEVAKAVQASYPGVRVIALSSTDEIMVLGTAAEHAQLARQLKDLAANAGKKEPGKE